MSSYRVKLDVPRALRSPIQPQSAEEVKMEILRLAVGYDRTGHPEEVIRAAKAFQDFLTGGT